MRDKTQMTADIWLLFVAFIWGTTFVIVQNALSFLPPFTFNALRFLLAAIIMGIPVIFLFKNKPIKNKRGILLSGFIMGLFLYIGYGFQTIGLVYTTSSKAAFITGLSVVLVPIASLILFKQRPRLIVWIACLFSVTGLYMMTMTGGGSFNFGDSLVLICAFGFAFHIIVTGRFSAKLDAFLLTIVQIMTVGILSLLTALLLEDWQKAFQPAFIFQFDVILALLVTALLATSLAFFIQTNVQKYTSATRVAIIFAFEPIFAALTSYIVLKESLSAAAAIGCLFIFLSMILSELPTPKKKGEMSAPSSHA
ncbi:EamA-like transporter family protein [Bacillus oleivorans]|uniref:EamA-like transporter family protein n=1 Tax=Bacillus oleivorans TaxID=1448271 RepID=A0A285CMD2_9BACI|nr:DMT family transporter [Bacillus oleivorans]SNX68218.1 EamA-like transporter family protein [Bacillus oleivorans]